MGKVIVIKGADFTSTSFKKVSLSIVASPVITYVKGETSTVSLSCSTTGAAIYYTTNGSTPSTSSNLYSSPFTVSQNVTVKAIAVVGQESSSVTAKEVSVMVLQKITYNAGNIAASGASVVDNKIIQLREGKYLIDNQVSNGFKRVAFIPVPEGTTSIAINKPIMNAYGAITFALLKNGFQTQAMYTTYNNIETDYLCRYFSGTSGASPNPESDGVDYTNAYNAGDNKFTITDIPSETKLLAVCVREDGWSIEITYSE